MIKAVLFDLDETLLDLNLEAYVWAYVSQRARLLGRIVQSPPIALALPLWRALASMLGRRDDTDDLTNAAYLNAHFEQETGIPLTDPVIADCLAYYDERVFNPQMAASKTVDGRPRRGAHACLEMCQRLGVKTALATNPTFPEACTRERMRWAGIADHPFAHVTFAENSTRAKPWGLYYAQVCAAIGERPEDCLMVGNDPRNDFARDGVPLRTCYVGRGRPENAYWSGDPVGLAAALPFLVAHG